MSCLKGSSLTMGNHEYKNQYWIIKKLSSWSCWNSCHWHFIRVHKKKMMMGSTSSWKLLIKKHKVNCLLFRHLSCSVNMIFNSLTSALLLPTFHKIKSRKILPWSFNLIFSKALVSLNVNLRIRERKQDHSKCLIRFRLSPLLLSLFYEWAWIVCHL